MEAEAVVTAVGGGLKGLTVRDFLSRGGGELLREPNFRKEMWQLTKNLFADASDQMIEEFPYTATDHIIRAGTLEEDLRFGDVLEDAAYSGFLGGGTGGLLPQLRHGGRFYEKVPGAITITGSPPDTPGNPFRNPDGTLPLKEQFHESGDPDLKAKEGEFIEILNRPIEEVDAAYDAIPDAHGGKVISTDLPLANFFPDMTPRKATHATLASRRPAGALTDGTVFGGRSMPGTDGNPYSSPRVVPGRGRALLSPRNSSPTLTWSMMGH